MVKSQPLVAKASRKTWKERQKCDECVNTRALSRQQSATPTRQDIAMGKSRPDTNSATYNRRCRCSRRQRSAGARPALDATPTGWSHAAPTTHVPPTDELNDRRWSDCRDRWAEAREKIARMTLTIKLDRNWSSFQLANSTPPLSVTGSAIAPSARLPMYP